MAEGLPGSCELRSTCCLTQPIWKGGEDHTAFEAILEVTRKKAILPHFFHQCWEFDFGDMHDSTLDLEILQCLQHNMQVEENT